MALNLADAFTRRGMGPMGCLGALTPSDTVDAANLIRFVQCAAGGTAAFHFWDGTTGSIALVANQLTPVCARRLMSTGTDGGLSVVGYT